MNLGIIEHHLLRVLEGRLGGGVDLRAGPVEEGPATGTRNELFVHAARFTDLGGRTAEGAQVARRPVRPAPGVSGFVEERPAVLEVELTCVCAKLVHAQALAGMVATAALEGLETLQPVLLSDPGDGARSLRFGDHGGGARAEWSPNPSPMAPPPSGWSGSGAWRRANRTPATRSGEVEGTGKAPGRAPSAGSSPTGDRDRFAEDPAFAALPLLLVAAGACSPHPRRSPTGCPSTRWIPPGRRNSPTTGFWNGGRSRDLAADT